MTAREATTDENGGSPFREVISEIWDAMQEGSAKPERASDAIHRADRAAYGALVTARTLAHDAGAPVDAMDLLRFAMDEVAK